MSAITGQELADFLYNRKLPVLYRNMDASETEKQDLYRYLQAVFQGGFNTTLEQIAAMTDLVNPLTCPVEYLPYLYQSFGLPYFEDIGEYYNRRFLASIGEFLRRRGTIGGVRYLVRVLTGMESQISYERVMNEKEHSRYLHVYPVFPDVTSLAEIEVTSYTIKRFLDLHLPFYLRSIFFPFIETQYLVTDIHNGVSLANTIVQYLFSDKDRTLSINNKRAVSFYDSSFYNFGGEEKEYKKQIITSELKTAMSMGTRMLSYDLTKLEGKKLQIGNWITNGDYRLRIPVYSLIFEVFMMRGDLFKPSVKKLQIPLCRVNGFVSFKQNDLRKDDERSESLTRIQTLRGDKTSSYDLTGLSGRKLYTPEFLRRSYKMEINNSRNWEFNIISIQDATFIDGDYVTADYSDLYNHSYNLRKSYQNTFALTDAKSYNFVTEREPQKFTCGIRSSVMNFSVVQYDLRGDGHVVGRS